MSCSARPSSNTSISCWTSTRSLDEGEVATYIPELGQADPSSFGIVVVTTDGHVYEVGDTDLEFTIQSISKPFVFGMALEDCGRDAVLERVGVEPSGNPFNAIVVDDRNRPFNPMVNAGAIVATGLIDPRFAKIADAPHHEHVRQVRRAGPGSLDEKVYRSESATGDRNRSIAWLMRSFGMIDGDVDAIVDDYFQQCSLLVNCRDLATMAATLANRGVNPITGEHALDARYVENVLSVMSTCGMYDYAGEWVYTVGLPAKSGVAGGVIAVLPGQLGIGVFSPRLDERGNSARASGCASGSPTTSTSIRCASSPRCAPWCGAATTPARPARTGCARPPSTRCSPTGVASVAVFELQGDLFFSSAERLFRTRDGRARRLDPRDLRLPARRRDRRRRGVGVVGARARSSTSGACRSCSPTSRPITSSNRSPPRSSPTPTARSNGARRRCSRSPASTTATPRRCCRSPSRSCSPACRPRSSRPSTRWPSATRSRRARWSSARATSPTRSTSCSPAGSGCGCRWGTGRERRLATLGPGVAFGEMALLDEARRSADIVAETDSVVARLPIADFRRLALEHPGITEKFSLNLVRNLERAAAPGERAGAPPRGVRGQTRPRSVGQSTVVPGCGAMRHVVADVGDDRRGDGHADAERLVAVDHDVEQVALAVEGAGGHPAADARTGRRRSSRGCTSSGRTATSADSGPNVGPNALVTFQPRKRATNSLAGRRHTSLGRALLLDAALVHHHEAVGEREGLAVVVGDEQDRQAEPGEQRPQLGDQTVAQRAVERTERLVEHQQARLRGERAREGDALLLAARELRDAAGAEAVEADERERLLRAGLRLGACRAPACAIRTPRCPPRRGAGTARGPGTSARSRAGAAARSAGRGRPT